MGQPVCISLRPKELQQRNPVLVSPYLTRALGEAVPFSPIPKGPQRPSGVHANSGSAGRQSTSAHARAGRSCKSLIHKASARPPARRSYKSLIHKETAQGSGCGERAPCQIRTYKNACSSSLWLKDLQRRDARLCARRPPARGAWSVARGPAPGSAGLQPGDGRRGAESGSAGLQSGDGRREAESGRCAAQGGRRARGSTVHGSSRKTRRGAWSVVRARFTLHASL